METIPAEDPLGRSADLLREVRDASGWILPRLTSAGFDDLREDELLAIAAIGMFGPAAREVLHRLGIADQSIAEISDSLVERGYLELRGQEHYGPAGRPGRL